jgi:hypothetical protein
MLSIQPDFTGVGLSSLIRLKSVLFRRWAADGHELARPT